jgi:hypothetical protein
MARLSGKTNVQGPGRGWLGSFVALVAFMASIGLAQSAIAFAGDPANGEVALAYLDPGPGASSSRR